MPFGTFRDNAEDATGVNRGSQMQPVLPAQVAGCDLVRLDEQPEVLSSLIFGDTFVKTYRMKKSGTALPQHSHRYDHITQICNGGVRVFLDGKHLGDFYTGGLVKIPAGTKHLFVTTEDWTVLSCIHHDPTGEGAVDVIEEHQIVNLD